MLSGALVEARTQTGSKEVRAAGLAAQVQMGNVDYIADADWDHRAMLDEMRTFPSGLHDDIVDAAASAFNRLVATPIVVDSWGGGEAFSGMRRQDGYN